MELEISNVDIFLGTSSIHIFIRVGFSASFRRLDVKIFADCEKKAASDFFFFFFTEE